MKFPYFPQRGSRGWACSAVPGLIVIFAALLYLRQSCQAQQLSAAQSDASADPLNNINWFSGPQNVSLGDVADIHVPPGYHFTDVHGARIILASFNDVIPDDLLGIVAPTPGHWMAILEFSPLGYVKNPAVMQINSKKILKQILNQIQKPAQSPVTSLSWQSPPVYDAMYHVLDWSLQVITPSSKILNQTAVIFGRRGVLQITMVQHLSDHAPSVKQLVSAVTFKPGERYADYRNGDKVADVGLAEIVSGENHRQAGGFFNGGFGSAIAWTYGGLAACLLTGGVVVARRRTKTQRRRSGSPDRGTPTPAPAIHNKSPVNRDSSNSAAAILKNGGFIGPVQPKPSVNRSLLAMPFRRRRRKRIFNYSKFYGKIMSELSGYAYGPPVTFKSKFHSNSHSNGHGNADTHSQDAMHNTKATQTTQSEIENLIAIQKSLIEQQKCFLEEQTRLIEEKRRILEEQTALLKTQSSLAIDPQSYPIKIAQ